MNITFALFGIVLFMYNLHTMGVNAADKEFPSPEFVMKLRPIVNKCAAKTGVTNEAIKQFNDGRMQDEDEALKCYMDCVFEESDFLDANGEVNFEKILEAMPESMIMIAVNMGKNCLQPKGDTRCEKAYWVHRCWRKHDPKHYVLV